MENKLFKAILITIFILIIILIIWGIIGANEAKKIGVTCDTGIGDTFCWKWHKNVLGQIGEAFENLQKT